MMDSSSQPVIISKGILSPSGRTWLPESWDSLRCLLGVGLKDLDRGDSHWFVLELNPLTDLPTAMGAGNLA